MLDHDSMGANEALTQRLEDEAKRLVHRRSPDLAARIQAALPDAPEAQARQARPWLKPLIGLAAASVVVALWLTRSDEDPAHPALASLGTGVPTKNSAASSLLTDSMRELVTLGQTLGGADVSRVPKDDLLAREARLLVEDVNQLAASVIAGLPLAALPATWKQKLETP